MKARAGSEKGVALYLYTNIRDAFELELMCRIQKGRLNEKFLCDPHYIDAGHYLDVRSGQDFTKRSSWNEMIRRCRNGEIDIVMTPKIPCLSRDSMTAYENLKACEDGHQRLLRQRRSDFYTVINGNDRNAFRDRP